MSLQSGCSSGSDLLDRGAFHLEGAHLRSAFDQVADNIGDPVELFTLICVCMLFRLPKADSENAIGVFVGDQSDFVEESRLTLQDSEDFIIHCASEVSGFPGFAGYFYDSGKHTRYSFR